MNILLFQTLHLEPVSEMNLRESNLTIVVEVDADGNIVDSLQGDSGQIIQISETQKVGENLFFASPYNKYLGRLDLRPPSMEVEGQGVRMKIGGTEENLGESSDSKASEQQTKEESQSEAETDVKEETKEKEKEEVKSDSAKEEL